MLPFLLPALLSAVQLGSQYFKGKKEAEYQKELEAAQKKKEAQEEKQRRRAALSSAIGYNDPAYFRSIKTPEAPDLSSYDLAGGLAGLGSTYASQNLSSAAPKSDSIDDILAQYPMGLRKRFNPYG